MSNMQDVREEIIRESIPCLVSHLTGFSSTEENFRRCEQFALYTIKNHRNLSVNSHEIKRKIEGFEEKFQVANYPQVAELLRQLCDEFVKHPLCVLHYEVDIHWSVLEFLFSLAYNPIGGLRNNSQKIEVATVRIAESQILDDYDISLKNSLKEDFIDNCQHLDSESDLSVWSEEDEDSIASDLQSIDSFPTIDSIMKFDRDYPFKPPQKAPVYQEFNWVNSRMRLYNSVREDWWNSDTESHVETSSLSKQANFAQLYNVFLYESTNHLIKVPNAGTQLEHSLLEEIIWMFNFPITCKFFKVVDRDISVQNNITVPSVTVHGLKSYLENTFIPYIKMLSCLRQFIDSVNSQSKRTASITLEYYTTSLTDLLKPVYQAIVEADASIQKQEPVRMLTLIQLQLQLRESMTFLKKIYDVHVRVALDLNTYPAHITTSYLLSSLMLTVQDAQNAETANLSIALFLTSIKHLCQIIETWWREGRLDDWKHEFVVERRSESKVVSRQFLKNREKSFFVPTPISSVIVEDRFINLLLSHSEEAGSTLGFLSEINRISDLRNSLESKGKIYDQFLNEVLLRIEEHTGKDFPGRTMFSENTGEDHSHSAEEEIHQILNSLTTDDHLLLAVFACNLDEPKANDKDCRSKEKSEHPPLVRQIFEYLNDSTSIIIPFEEIIITSMKRILNKRIAFSNQFVINTYLEEFEIKKHLQNVRKVLLLECSDLMYYFYSKLFIQIEAEATWANPFQLTVQLDDIISSKFPELQSMFRVDVLSTYRCATKEVIDAVDELTIDYSRSNEISQVITSKSLEDYNRVFRFLLKVKWGIWALENLHYPVPRKRVVPYAPLQMKGLIMRRLEQVRFWMIYALQCIHFHLMSHVLVSMGAQLDEKINKCSHIMEMIRVHESYIATVCEHCFLGQNLSNIRNSIEQLINLVSVLRTEWALYMEESESLMAMDTATVLDEDSFTFADSTSGFNVSTLDGIELSYIKCHQFLANSLNNEVYLKQSSFLSGLSAAFNACIPY